MEVIPNSLQEEWTEAWNATHVLRQAAMKEEENERGTQVDTVAAARPPSYATEEREERSETI